ncbi:hypothetical protein WN944_013117 [Citrus x changshan-huyou]|uniref:Uncharacterized protein n=1 Tax=Citrus x changshan-huyou TaxID=2935761 RepID=A0AAP0M3I2_9ROSI
MGASYFYWSMTDPCMYGALWAGIEDPVNSGNFTTSKVALRCAHNSQIDVGLWQEVLCLNWVMFSLIC